MLARFRLLPGGGREFVPTFGSDYDAYDEQHHRDLNQHAHDGRERGARFEAEQADRGRHGQLE